MAGETFDKRNALAFIVAFGVVSLFADMAYEGMRGITGPYLALLGASGAVVGIVAGTGELFGYVLRLFSGRLAEKTGAYWTVTLAGYVLQMAAVPLMALAGTWWMVALFIVCERTGKAFRNPSANFMMSRAGKHIGQGWAFGLHEALDQTGALVGPLIAALVLAHHGQYSRAFLWLGVPATLTVLTVIGLSLRFSFAGKLAQPVHGTVPCGPLPRVFWLYAASAACMAFGFADWTLVAYHFAENHIVSQPTIPILYAIAMGGSGAGALALGRSFDARGFAVLLPAILAAACVAPLAFLGGGGLAVAGAVLWGVVLGVENSVLSAGVAHLVPEQSRARAYGIFSAVFGVAWFAGSALLGMLYDRSLTALAAVSVAAELAAILPLISVMRAAKNG
jgi:predicted MFS family arabinose efflux permease